MCDTDCTYPSGVSVSGVTPVSLCSVSLSESFVSMYMWKCPVYPLVETPSLQKRLSVVPVDSSALHPVCQLWRILIVDTRSLIQPAVMCLLCIVIFPPVCRSVELFCLPVIVALLLHLPVLLFVMYLSFITSGAMELWINCCAGENPILSIGVWQYSRGACKGDC